MFGAGYAAPEQEFNMILTVTMNPSIDTRYQLDKLIIDDVNRVTPEKTAGGKGLNVSRVLLQLGDDVLATGLLGGHMGAYMAELMDADGVKNDFVPIAGETRICLNILHEGNQTELLESGPQIAPAELEAFTAKFAELAAKADVVTLSGSLPRGVDAGYYAELVKIAEEAGACAVMALERIPADIRAAGGVSRMSDPKMIKGIQEAVSIPVMAKCRIGHIVEAQVLQAIEIDYIDESEVLSPADDVYHIDKTQFDVPFVCGARDLGEALRRVAEGATMIRTKGEPGTGDVVQAVRHMRKIQKQIRDVVALRDDELFEAAKQLQVPVELVREVHATGKLPVVNFAAGGVATPADAALMMQLGAEGVFVGSGIFKSGDPAKRAAAIVKAVANFTDAKLIAELSEDLGEAMVGINADEIEIIMEERGR